MPTLLTSRIATNGPEPSTSKAIPIQNIFSDRCSLGVAGSTEESLQYKIDGSQAPAGSL